MQGFVELLARLAELERIVATQIRHGTVAEVDATKQRVRLSLGKDTKGKEFLGPWVPYGQVAGALKVHSPPSVGQTMTLISPSGDPQQGVAMPLTWSTANPSPGDKKDEHALTIGNVRMDLKDGQFKLTIAGVVFDFTDQGLHVNGGHIRHNGKRIDADHVHSGIVRGGANTDPPAN